ncbi:MAG: aryl-sulfate sulfotransferase [Bacilli bacterium]
MKFKKIKILITLTVVIISTFIIYNCFINKEEVSKAPDILSTQYNLEKEYSDDLEKKVYTINNPKVILDPYNNSPLTAIVLFKTIDEEEVYITILGKDDKATINQTFSKTRDHIIPIYGLYPDYDNKVIIKVNDIEKEITIKTDSLPDDFILPTDVYVDKNEVNNDLIFVTPAMTGYTAAYDINGDVRWYLIGNYAWDIKRLNNGHLLLSSNRPINPPYYTVGLVEIDLSGKIYKEYVLPGGYHHDVYEMEDGNLLVASNKFIKGTVEDYVVLLNRETGAIEKEWDLSNILPEEEGKSENWVVHDWFHNNAVWYNNETNSITLSGRHQDAVINIDYDNGKLNWIIGDRTSWSEGMQKYFFTPIDNDFEWQWSQHAAMVLPNGNVFIFDNGNNRSKIKKEYINANDNYSRGVIYKIDTNNMTINQVWQYGKERGSSYYSPYISDVDYYEDSHYLVHSGGISSKDGKALNKPAPFIEGAKLNSITTEIKNNKVIFEIELPSNFYRAEKLSLYSSNNLVFEKGKRIGSLGETEPTDEKNNLLISTTSIPKDYNVSFTKESDRLIFKGRFKEHTEIYLILDNAYDQRSYLVPISNMPYTAMCINIFNDETDEDCEEIDITYYVNEENISGKYNIYVKIGNKIYNTKKHVEFN